MDDSHGGAPQFFAAFSENFEPDFVAPFSRLNHTLAEAGDAIVGDGRSINCRREIVWGGHLEKFASGGSQRSLRSATISSAGDRLQCPPSDPRAAAFIACDRSPAAGGSALALPVHPNCD